jgi:predicted flap endonuclease-1-like 5' DNA nuclease
MAHLDTVEGIGPTYQEKLAGAGITTTEMLLEKGRTAKGRQKVAAAADIDATYILEWLNRLDMDRIKGIGSEYADLLEAAGVDTVPELAQRNADNLYAKLKEINEAKDLVRRLPSAEQVADWVAQAKALPRILEY